MDRLKFYHDDVPLFSRFQIEHQIETAYSTVPFPGGSSCDHTALVSVDVIRRAQFVSWIEHTALNNLGAAVKSPGSSCGFGRTNRYRLYRGRAAKSA